MRADDSFIHLLHRAQQVAEQVFSEEYAGELTARQLTVLKVIEANPRMSQTEIVAATGIDRSTLADVVKRLVDRGLLMRRRSRQDARAYQVSVTPAGLAGIEAATPALVKAERVMLEVLGESERGPLVDALTRIVIAATTRTNRSSADDAA